jgi:hypothetical protein
MKAPSEQKLSDVTSKESMLTLVLAVAKKADVKVAIGGGLAVNAHGFRRETADVDAFFHYNDQHKVLRALNQLASDYHLEQLHPSQWISIPPGAEPDERIDLLFASGDPEESAIEMSEMRNCLGIPTPVFPIDLLVISKFLADRDDTRDLLDILTLHRRGAFDIEEITLKLHQMGLEEDAVRFQDQMKLLKMVLSKKRK